jgi:hypothetical protein
MFTFTPRRISKQAPTRVYAGYYRLKGVKILRTGRGQKVRPRDGVMHGKTELAGLACPG